MTDNITTPSPPLTIAIIGTGIIGTSLALGLLSRSVPVKVYEQASSHRTIGAGIAFTANARECLRRIDPRLEDCVARAATVNGDPGEPNHNMQFVDGYGHDEVHREVGSDMVGRVVWRLFAGEHGFDGCHRAEFLAGVLDVLGQEGGVVQWGKRVDRYILPEDGDDNSNDNDKVKLVFVDGSTAEADVVIGCDGIKSRVRQHLFGLASPISNPHYTHKVAFRGLIPMSVAIEKLGKYRATNQHMYGGPGAHVLHFPVAGQKLMNVVAFVDDSDDWPLDRPMTQPASVSELKAAFEQWGPTVRAIIDLLTESQGLDKWAVFDHFEYPAPWYAPPRGTAGYGRVCIAGDAAHASSPHHGAGAGIGVEDVLALCRVLERVRDDVGSGKRRKREPLGAALEAYSNVRLERSQWLVRSSREVCGIYEWADPEIGPDMHRGLEDVKERSHKIWYFDIDGMLEELDGEYQRLLETV